MISVLALAFTWVGLPLLSVILVIVNDLTGKP